MTRMYQIGLLDKKGIDKEIFVIISEDSSCFKVKKHEF